MVHRFDADRDVLRCEHLGADAEEVAVGGAQDIGVGSGVCVGVEVGVNVGTSVGVSEGRRVGVGDDGNGVGVNSFSSNGVGVAVIDADDSVAHPVKKRINKTLKRINFRCGIIWYKSCYSIKTN